MLQLEAMKDFSSLGKSIALEMSRAGGRAGGAAARDQSGYRQCGWKHSVILPTAALVAATATTCRDLPRVEL